MYAHSKLPKPRRTSRPASPSFSVTRTVGVESADLGLGSWKDLERYVSEDDSAFFRTLVMRKEWKCELWERERESFKEMGREVAWRKERR